MDIALLLATQVVALAGGLYIGRRLAMWYAGRPAKRLANRIDNGAHISKMRRLSDGSWSLYVDGDEVEFFRNRSLFVENKCIATREHDVQRVRNALQRRGVTRPLAGA